MHPAGRAQLSDTRINNGKARASLAPCLKLAGIVPPGERFILRPVVLPKHSGVFFQYCAVELAPDQFVEPTLRALGPGRVIPTGREAFGKAFTHGHRAESKVRREAGSPVAVRPITVKGISCHRTLEKSTQPILCNTLSSSRARCHRGFAIRL